MKRAMSFYVFLSLICAHNNAEASKEVFLSAAMLGFPTGALQEFDNSASQPAIEGSLTAGAVVLPSILCFKVLAEQSYEGRERDYIDNAFLFGTMASWGAWIGYQLGALCGSVGRLVTGRDNARNSRVIGCSKAVMQGMTEGIGREVGKEFFGLIQSKIEQRPARV